jgi:hypothetical protein
MEVEFLVRRGRARKSTALFLAIIVLVFGLTWSAQIVTAILTGSLPTELVSAGWPMNPVYVLDLGFVLPLAAIGAVRVWRNVPGGARISIPFLVFAALLALSILLMAASAALSGQPLAVPMIAIFTSMLAISTALAARALMASSGARDAVGSLKASVPGAYWDP